MEEGTKESDKKMSYSYCGRVLDDSMLEGRNITTHDHVRISISCARGGLSRSCGAPDERACRCEALSCVSLGMARRKPTSPPDGAG